VARLGKQEVAMCGSFFPIESWPNKQCVGGSPPGMAANSGAYYKYKQISTLRPWQKRELEVSMSYRRMLSHSAGHRANYEHIVDSGWACRAGRNSPVLFTGGT